MPTSSALYQPLPSASRPMRHLPTSGKLCQPLPASVNLCWPLPASAIPGQPLQSPASPCQPQAAAAKLCQCKPLQTSPARTRENWQRYTCQEERVWRRFPQEQKGDPQVPKRRVAHNSDQNKKSKQEPQVPKTRATKRGDLKRTHRYPRAGDQQRWPKQDIQCGTHGKRGSGKVPKTRSKGELKDTQMKGDWQR